MKPISTIAIYTLWLREIKHFLRAKSQLLGNMMHPFFFLVILGVGLSSTMEFKGFSSEASYLDFLIPGVIGMSLLYRSISTGFSILEDLQFGFLKEIMVAPVSRISIVIGRILGGVTISLTQALLILGISFMFGFQLSSMSNFFLALLFMMLISLSFNGLGTIFASIIDDFQGFQMVMTFLITPVFFLSGALFPLDGIPRWMRILSHLDPLTYGIDGLRYYLTGSCYFSVFLNFSITLVFSMATMVLSTYFFNKCNV